MQKRFFLGVLALVSFIQAINAQVSPGRRFDTTMKIGKVGYRVVCTNRNIDKNIITINPVGFEKDAREVSAEIKGRVNKAEVDDLNGDGFPDLVVYVLNNGVKNKSTVFGISSEKNEGFRPIFFPDIVDDPKVRDGYDGHDEYSLIEGTLVRRFAVYNTTDTANVKPTGMIRQIQYRIVVGERAELRFKISRSYEYAKQ